MRGSVFGGLLTAFGLLFVLFPMAFVVLGIVLWDLLTNLVMLTFILLVMLVFIVFGLMAVYMGLNQLLSRATILISSDAVECAGRRLFGQKNWTEPLQNYQGVVKEFSYHANESWTFFRVVLKHRDRDKDIPLFNAEGVLNESLWEQSWKQFGQTLGLPLFEATADGLMPVEPGSLQRLAEKYAAKLGGTDAIRLSKKAVVERTENGLRVTHPHYWGCWRGASGMAISSGCLVFALFLFRSLADGIWIFLAVMALFLLIGFSSFITDLFSVEELFIQREQVEYWKRYGRRIRSHKVIDLENIIQVAVKKDPKRRGVGTFLWLADGRDTVLFGNLLPKDDKTVLKEYILAKSFGRQDAI